MQPKNLFSFLTIEDEKYSINLDTPETDQIVSDIYFPLNNESIPDFLSLFYHNTETIVEKSNEFIEGEKTQRRYYADTLICYECGETGHINKKCPKRIKDVCILCAQKGHERRNCPMMICNKCYLCGHQSRFCPAKDLHSRYQICRRCPSGEHTVRDCPSQWREYRIKDCVITSNIRKSCCLCFSDKHFVDDCKKNRTRFSIFNSDYLSIIKLYKK